MERMEQSTRPIVHISDLHYDCSVERRAAVVAELRRVRALDPRVVLVSGDLSASGVEREFEEVAELLAVLGDVPVVITPGNRDLPELELRELWENDDEDEGTSKWAHVKRGFASLGEARAAERLLVGDPTSSVAFVRSFGACNFWHVSDEETIVSLNSNRKVYRTPLEAAGSLFRKSAPEAVRIVMCHHPFLPVPLRPWESDIDMPRNAGDVLRVLLDSKVDLVGTGHLHRSHTGIIGLDGRAVQVSLAPTLIYATRKKDRGYHVIRTDGPRPTIEAVRTQPDYEATGLRGLDAAIAPSSTTSITAPAMTETLPPAITAIEDIVDT